MLSNTMQETMNKQINAELHSAYVYLSMSAYFEAENLPGFAHWMRLQAQEEMGHAMRFYNFIHERRGRVLLEPIGAVPTSWEHPLAAFQAAFEHEQHISALINQLVDLAITEKDHAANSFLQWFVDEQVEEEASADAIVQQLRRVGTDGTAIFMLDQQMAARTLEAGGDGEG